MAHHPNSNHCHPDPGLASCLGQVFCQLPHSLGSFSSQIIIPYHIFLMLRHPGKLLLLKSCSHVKFAALSYLEFVLSYLVLSYHMLPHLAHPIHPGKFLLIGSYTYVWDLLDLPKTANLSSVRERAALAKGCPYLICCHLPCLACLSCMTNSRNRFDLVTLSRPLHGLELELIVSYPDHHVGSVLSHLFSSRLGLGLLSSFLCLSLCLGLWLI